MSKQSGCEMSVKQKRKKRYPKSVEANDSGLKTSTGG